MRGSRPTPRQVVEVALEAPLPVLCDAGAHPLARVLVRLHGHPLGVVEVDLAHGPLPAAVLGERIVSELGSALARHLADDAMPPAQVIPAGGLGPPPGRCSRDVPDAVRPLVSVVVASRYRPDLLRACVESVLAGSYDRFELLVVDNGPDRPETAEVVRALAARDARVRMLREPRPGVAVARNAGLADAHGDVVAFVDDDVILDPRWLQAVASAFGAVEDVGCVTCLIMPLELETPAQIWLEEFGGFAKGFERWVADLDRHRLPDPLYPWSAGVYGSGAGMAFDTELLRSVGGFDVRLATGGEDLDLFLEVLFAGRRIVYEPSAIAWHRHPREYAALRRTMFHYGAGLSSLMVKWAASSTGNARAIASRVPAAARLALDPGSRKNARKQPGYPLELTLRELAGVLSGPLVFARGAWAARRS
jgi:GT2 family glycosyltransferase